MFKLKNFAKVVNGVVVGVQQSKNKPIDNELFECDEITQIGDTFDGENFTPFVLSLQQVKTEKIAQIKREAANRISSFDWQISRATRRTALGKPQKRAKNDVYQLQHDIEVASDNAEIAINAMVTVDEINNFTW